MGCQWKPLFLDTMLAHILGPGRYLVTVMSDQGVETQGFRKSTVQWPQPTRRYWFNSEVIITGNA